MPGAWGGYRSGMETLSYVGIAALVVLIFVGIWWWDARRAEKVSHDEERADQGEAGAVSPEGDAGVVPPNRTWNDD